MIETQGVECWHFLQDDGYMQFGERIKVEPGITYSVKGKPRLCEHGFHGSRKVLDALSYAPGALCCRVLISGEIKEEDDKLAGLTRKVLWMADATRILHEFACDIAERLLEKHGIADPRCHAAIQTKRLWLEGAKSDNDLAAAKAAAKAAAWDATWAAAPAAAWDATWAAAWGAAKAAAWDATWAAAWAAAWGAANGAAWDAARDASWDALNLDLETRIYALETRGSGRNEHPTP